MNRSYGRSFGNLPIAWANSPSIVFNQRTSGWMPPEYSTLMGREQIVRVGPNGERMEMSNDFPMPQVAVWQGPRGQIPPDATVAPPFAPGVPMAGWGDFSLGGIGDLLSDVLTAPLKLLTAEGRAELASHGLVSNLFLGALWFWGIAFVATFSKTGMKLVSKIPGMKWASWQMAKLLNLKGARHASTRRNPRRRRNAALTSGKPGKPWSGKYGKGYQARFTKKSYRKLHNRRRSHRSRRAKR